MPKNHQGPGWDYATDQDVLPSGYVGNLSSEPQEGRLQLGLVQAMLRRNNPRPIAKRPSQPRMLKH